MTDANYLYRHIEVGICSQHGYYQSEGGCPGCAQEEDKIDTASEIESSAQSAADWRDEPEFQRLRQAWYAIECEDKRLIAEKAVRIAELEAENAQLRADRAFKAGFMAATKYATGHLSDEQVALVQDAEWDSYAGRIQTPSAQP